MSSLKLRIILITLISFVIIFTLWILFFQDYSFSRTQVKNMDLQERADLLQDKNPESAEAYLEMSGNFFLNGEIQKSKDYFNKAQAIGLMNPQEFYLAGWINDHFYNFENARSSYFKAYQQEPTNEIYGLMFILDSIVLSNNDAKEIIDIFIKKNPHSEFYDKLIKLQGLIEKHSKTFEFKKDLFYFFRENAYSAQAIGIGRLLLESYQIKNNNSDFFFDLGKLETESRNGKEAENIFSKLIDLDPNNSDFRLGLAESYILLRKNSDALKQAQLAVETNPNTHSLTVLGTANALNGEVSKAKQNLMKASSMDGNNAKAYFQLGKIYEKEDKQKAIEFYLKAMDSDGLNIYEIIYAGNQIDK